MPDGTWLDVIFASEIFVAISEYSILYSKNGKAWIPVPGFERAISLYKIAHGNGIFVVLGKDISTAPHPYVVLFGSDIEHLESVSLPENFIPEGLAFGKGMFIIGGRNETALYSENGKDWTAETVQISGYDLGDVLIYGGDLFVSACKRNGNSTNIFAYSDDGKNWIPATVPIADTCKAMAYGDGNYVASCYNVSIISSPFSRAMLPKISMGEVPGYIKAKETEL